MKHVFWIILGTLTFFGVVLARCGYPYHALGEAAIVTVLLVQRACTHEWRSHARLWIRERELRLLDWEIDDTDDEMLNERRTNGNTDTFYSILDWLNRLHVRRKELCNEILALRLHLDVEAPPLDFFSRWADRNRQS